MASASGLGIALEFQIGSAETVAPQALANLAGGQPVQIENVDDLIEPTPDGPGPVRYPAGTLTLQPDELAGFLAFEGADDPAPNQALRAQAVWEQLFAAADDADLASLPEGQAAEGSTSPGFGPTVQSLVAGDPRFDQVPIAKVPVPDSYFVAWMPDPANIDGFVARVVPLPQSPAPGIRTPVELLNGTPDDTATGALVAKIVEAGGEVALIGNAESFDVATTTVEYSEGGAETAEALASVLQDTATEATSPIEGATVRVVVGSDALG